MLPTLGKKKNSCELETFIPQYKLLHGKFPELDANMLIHKYEKLENLCFHSFLTVWTNILSNLVTHIWNLLSLVSTVQLYIVNVRYMRDDDLVLHWPPFAFVP